MSYMAAKRPLREEMQGARSAVWSFHSSDERRRRSPAKALPFGFRRAGPTALLLTLRMRITIRRGSRLAFGPARLKRGSCRTLS